MRVGPDWRETGLPMSMSIFTEGPSDCCSRPVIPRNREPRSTRVNFSSWRRAKASMRCVSAAPRCAPLTGVVEQLAGLRVSFRQPSAQQFEAAENRREQIVEVMGDAAGQLADASIFCDCNSASRASSSASWARGARSGRG